MTQAFSGVDETHIPIKCPAENSQDFFCYKQYHSLSVCDYRGYFHDAEGFTNFCQLPIRPQLKGELKFQTTLLVDLKWT